MNKTTEQKNIPSSRPQLFSGVVVSDKMDKTAVVAVTRFVKHAKYHKYFKITKKYKAHDEAGHKVGDKVTIVETRPISKDKHYTIKK